ncbi:uncharacterized protein LOC122945981 [Bufo gargarizans]|uniref:uncharacterized protein LOC122945981 n=1 Tax=Bufo gargarizans TaxID=30331 RepID=UPI001CF144C7|nr:uncharacterized protein LOC122945981 [Bufo gargarizans]
MSASTFSYDTITADGIVSQITTPSEFLHISHSEFRTRDWERESKRLIASELHCVTLAECYKNGRIPRGLRVHLRPNLFPSNKEYCNKFETILNKCSMDIIVLSIEYLQKSISETRDKIATIEAQLVSTTSTQEWNDLKKKTEKILEDHRKYIEQTKRAKFTRDTEEYQLNRIYRWQWQESESHGYQQFGDYASSSSGSDRSSRRRPYRFFSPARPQNQKTPARIRRGRHSRQTRTLNDSDQVTD